MIDISETNWGELCDNVNKAFSGMGESLSISMNALDRHLEIYRAFSYNIDRRRMSADIIQSRYKVSSQVASWIAWKLPERLLPSREAVETLLTLERK